MNYPCNKIDIDKQIFAATSPKWPCLICGEDTPLEFEQFIGAKSNVTVCDKCKSTILAMRQHMEDAEEGKMIMD